MFLVVLLILLSNQSYCINNLLIVGDSLSSVYGVNDKDAWPKLLQDKINSKQLDYNIVNVSHAGDTSYHALATLKTNIEKYQPKYIMLIIGSNDGLQLKPIHNIRQNIEQLINIGLNNNSKIILVGLELPPNLGFDYSAAFKQIFIQLAKKYNLPVVSSLFLGFETNLQLFQADQIHPNNNAQPIIAHNIWQTLVKII